MDKEKAEGNGIECVQVQTIIPCCSVFFSEYRNLSTAPLGIPPSLYEQSGDLTSYILIGVPNTVYILGKKSKDCCLAADALVDQTSHHLHSFLDLQCYIVIQLPLFISYPQFVYSSANSNFIGAYIIIGTKFLIQVKRRFVVVSLLIPIAFQCAISH